VSSPPNRVDARDLPLVTIVIPSVSQGAYIEAAIESVLSRDSLRLDSLVGDRGPAEASVDASPSHQYADQMAFWTSKPDAGMCAADPGGGA
jgi:hypothetical protein